MAKRAKKAPVRKKTVKKRVTRGAPKKKPPSYRTVSSEKMPRFAGVPTFLRLPILQELGTVPDVDVLLCGVPFDGGSSFRPGARLAPRAVRDASSLARSFSAALGIDIYEELRVADGGDIPASPHDVEHAVAMVTERAEAIARSGVVGGFVGGDQTVTLGALRGIQRAKLKGVGMIHIDSHCNTATAAWGRELHHGSVIRCAVEEGLIVPRATLQLGIRGPYSSEGETGYSLSHGFEIVGIDEVKWDLHAAVSQVRKMVRKGPVYVSVDVSAVDPAYAPGTGIPSPGGMNTWDLQQILRALVGAEIVGFDVVEISPPYDPTGITSMLGVTILQEILASIADTRRSARPAPSTRRGGRVSA
ncbi:MAG: arginase family protein [Myxococcales bacterium]|nr:arginase family protein [Myxococcales bacterium]MCB9576540.1 arginase family protein [Polyangiaceae bacterium]